MPTAKTASSRRRKPVQARSRVTVDSILEAAARLFDRGAATTNGIARLAGVSIGSLYEYFPNKEAILASLIEEHVDAAVTALEHELQRLPPDSTPLSEALRHLVTALLEQHADRPGLHRVFVARVMSIPAVRPTVVAAERRLRASLVRWLGQHPEVAVPDLELAVRVTVEATDAAVHRFVEDDEGVDAAVFVEELTRLWGGYLRGSPSA